MNTFPVVLIILLIIAALLLIALNVHLSLQVRKLELRLRRFVRGRDGLSLEEAFAEKFEEIDKLNDLGKVLRSDLRDLRAIEKKNFTKYGIVKYDAFEDIGGKLSFVLALLNEEDTGIVLNAIHSKDNCFLYLKEIVKGESYIMLSNEEIKALQTAKKVDLSTDTQELMSTIEQIEEITKKDNKKVALGGDEPKPEDDLNYIDEDDVDKEDDPDTILPREWVSTSEDDSDDYLEGEEL